jgi:hypothetical protein
MKNVWKNIEQIGLVTSILVSIIALIISIKSCGDSNEALEISKKEFESKKLLVLQSNPSNMLPGFEFSSFNLNQKLQRLIIELPQNIYKEEIFVGPPDFHFSLAEIQDNLLTYIQKSIPIERIKTPLLIRSILIPIIIKSNFVFAGEFLWDISVYNLEFSYQQDNLNNMGSYIECKSLIFVNRLTEEHDHKEMLSKLSNICESNLRSALKSN